MDLFFLALFVVQTQVFTTAGGLSSMQLDKNTTQPDGLIEKRHEILIGNILTGADCSGSLYCRVFLLDQSSSARIQ